MKRIVQVSLGLPFCGGGYFLVNLAYKHWQEHRLLGYDGRLESAIQFLLLALAVFLVAVLLFLPDKHYGGLFVRILAHFMGVLLIIGAVAGTWLTFAAVAYAWGGPEPMYGMYFATIFGLLTCIALGTSIALIRRGRAGRLSPKTTLRFEERRGNDE